MIKKLLLSGIAFAALAMGSASAADLGRPVYKAPPPPLPPVISWTGWYVGLNAGGAWSNDNEIDNTINSTFCNTALNGCNPNQWSNALAAAVAPSFDTGHHASFIGGGQIGYNWEAAPWLYGLEADFQGADIHGDGSFTDTVHVPFSAAPFVPFTDATVNGVASEKLNFLGTFRGRLGWTTASTNPLLLYVTGGLAYGHTETDVSFSSHFTNCFCGPDPSTSISKDEWRAGWTVGSGLEWMFAPHWSLKGEYLYYDLGHVSVDNTLNQLNGAATPFVAVGITSEAHYKGNIARGGVNYHF